MLEGIEDLLQGQRAVGFLVTDLPNMTIGSTADLLQQFVTFEDVGLDFVLHSYIICQPLLKGVLTRPSITSTSTNQLPCRRRRLLRLLMFLRNLLGRQSDETADLQKYDRITFNININENIPDISEEAKAVHDEEQELTPSHPLYYELFRKE